MHRKGYNEKIKERRRKNEIFRICNLYDNKTQKSQETMQQIINKLQEKGK